MKKLTVIIPVFNEEKTLEEIVERVRKAPIDLEKELLIVNDASTDGPPGAIAIELRDIPCWRWALPSRAVRYPAARNARTWVLAVHSSERSLKMTP